MSIEQEIEEIDLMKTFASLMGDMITNESKSTTKGERKAKEGKIAVLVTPFDENDDIELELAGEFYLIILEKFWGKENRVKLGITDEDHALKGEIQNNLTNIIKKRINGINYFEGIVKDGTYEFLINNSLNKMGRVKWSELYISNDNEATLTIKKYGNEYIINNLNDEKINFIKTITSDHFSISYY